MWLIFFGKQQEIIHRWVRYREHRCSEARASHFVHLAFIKFCNYVFKFFITERRMIFDMHKSGFRKIQKCFHGSLKNILCPSLKLLSGISVSLITLAEQVGLSVLLGLWSKVAATMLAQKPPNGGRVATKEFYVSHKRNIICKAMHVSCDSDAWEPGTVFCQREPASCPQAFSNVRVAL